MKTSYIKNQSQTKLSSPMPLTTQGRVESIGTIGSIASSGEINEIWKWGADNLLPRTLSSISRTSAVHRRIIMDKSDYISGRGFKCDDQRAMAFTLCCNSEYDSLRMVVQRIAMDKCMFGNAVVELAFRDGKVALWHQDVTRCRVATDNNHIILHQNWSNFKEDESRVLPIFPVIELQEDGTLRTAIMYKDYEPQFENYGVPKYIAALNALSIAHKTDRWNITRLENAFSLSGVMVLDGSNATEDEAEEIAYEAKRRFEGTPGQVMFMVKSSADSDNSKFVPITTNNDGDWKSLHDQSTEDIIIAHSWFRTLSGMEYSSGFSAERVQNEYNIALSTIIKSEQQDIIEPIKQVVTLQMGWDMSTLAFVNTPPFDSKPSYLKVWEARKQDGLDYDPESEEQNMLLSQI